MGTNSGPESCSLRARPRRAAAAARPARGRRCARRCATGAWPAHARLPADARARRRPRRLASAGRGRLRAAAGGGLPGRARAAPGTFVADRRASAPPPRPRSRPARACASTSSPATPTSPASRAAPGCARSARCCARRPTARFGYPDPRGARGAAPGAGRAPAARARGRGRRARRDRRLRGRRAGVRAARAGARRAAPRWPSRIPGCRCTARSSRPPGATLVRAAGGRAGRARGGSWSGRRRRALDAVLVTPAHQSPTGVALSPAAPRRAAGVGRAARSVVVIEDDYDAEFRYDRAPLGGAAGARARPRGVPGHGQQDARARAAARLAGAARRRCSRRSPSRSCSPTRGCADARAARARAADRVAATTTATCARRAGATARAATRCVRGGGAPSAGRARHRPRRRAARDRRAGPRASTGSRSRAPPRRRSVGVYPLGYAYIEPRPRRRRARARLRQPRRAGDRGGHPPARRWRSRTCRPTPGADERRRRDREVVRERPARQAAVLEGAHDRGGGAAGRDLARPRAAPRAASGTCARARPRRRRSGRSACSRGAAALEHRAQLAPAGEPEVQRRADPLGGQRQAVAGGVAGEEDAVLDRRGAAGGGSSCPGSRTPAARGRRASLHRRLLDVVGWARTSPRRRAAPRPRGSSTSSRPARSPRRATAPCPRRGPAGGPRARARAARAGGWIGSALESTRRQPRRVDDQRRAQLAAVGVDGVAAAPGDGRGLELEPRAPAPGSHISAHSSR